MAIIRLSAITEDKTGKIKESLKALESPKSKNPHPGFTKISKKMEEANKAMHKVNI